MKALWPKRLNEKKDFFVILSSKYPFKGENNLIISNTSNNYC